MSSLINPLSSGLLVIKVFGFSIPVQGSGFRVQGLFDGPWLLASCFWPEVNDRQKAASGQKPVANVKKKIFTKLHNQLKIDSAGA
jgi:hypothetical protein